MNILFKNKLPAYPLSIINYLEFTTLVICLTPFIYKYRIKIYSTSLGLIVKKLKKDKFWYYSSTIQMSQTQFILLNQNYLYLYHKKVILPPLHDHFGCLDSSRDHLGQGGLSQLRWTISTCLVHLSIVMGQLYLLVWAVHLFGFMAHFWSRYILLFFWLPQ